MIHLIVLYAVIGILLNIIFAAVIITRERDYAVKDKKFDYSIAGICLIPYAFAAISIAAIASFYLFKKN